MGQTLFTWRAHVTARAVLSASLGWLVVVACCFVAQPAGAGGKDLRHKEIWAGVDVAENVWLIYSGATYAPFGDIHQDGLRLRVVGGYGQYEYSGLRCPAGLQKCRPRRTNFAAKTGFVDVLAGYQIGVGQLTAKAFVGAAGIGHFITPLNELTSNDKNNLDPENDAEGLEWGIKGGVELWLNIGESAYGAFNASWTSAHETFAASARLGYRLTPTISAGVEGGLNANANHDIPALLEMDDFEDAVRFGGFARLEWDGGELSAGAGFTSSITEDGSPYLTVNWITQF